MASSGDQPVPPRVNHNTNEQYTKVRLSPEELRVLKECNRESFYYRCLPIGLAAMSATHIAVKAGYLKPNPRWGSTFKVLGVGLVSYFLGKFSYQRQCAEKLMQLPNSPLGEALRNRYHHGATTLEYDIGDHSKAHHEHTDVASDIPRSREIDSDMNVQHQGLDDSYRPTVDSPGPVQSEAVPPEQKGATYEEMRQKNREAYESKKNDMYKKDLQVPRPQIPPPRSPHPEPQPTTDDSPRTGKKQKNQYGDVWED